MGIYEARSGGALRQQLVTGTFRRLLEQGRVGRPDVDAALAAVGHPPATEVEWCRATGEPTPRERRHGAGLTDRQYVILDVIQALAEHGGLGTPEGGLDMAAVNAGLAGRDERPSGRSEALAAIERSLAAIEARMDRDRRENALMRAVADLVAELGVASDEPVFGALDRAGLRSARLAEGGRLPSKAEWVLLEAVARECVAAAPAAAAVAEAARELLRRTLSDPALREAVLALALAWEVEELLQDDPTGSGDEEEVEEKEKVTPETGRLRAGAAVRLCRLYAPAEPTDLAKARLERDFAEVVGRHGGGPEGSEAVMERMKDNPQLGKALLVEHITRMFEIEIAQDGLRAA